MQTLDTIFQKLNIQGTACELIRSKDGISVYRLETAEEKLILKLFEKPEDRREIDNYRLLAALEIPTLPLKGYTENAMLLPDVTASEIWRLGREEDMADPQIARAVARWYRTLHEKGRQYLKKNPVRLYDETDVITPENMEKAAAVTGTAGDPIWQQVKENFDDVRKKLEVLPRTLTYNDFYWDNLIAAKDGSEAFMFDYNLLGQGLAYGDVRNVTSSLSREAAEAFREAYGTSEMVGVDEEKLADDFLAPMVTLCAASQREVFPAWAGDSLERLKSGELLKSFERWRKE